MRIRAAARFIPTATPAKKASQNSLYQNFPLLRIFNIDIKILCRILLQPRDEI